MRIMGLIAGGLTLALVSAAEIAGAQAQQSISNDPGPASAPAKPRPQAASGPASTAPADPPPARIMVESVQVLNEMKQPVAAKIHWVGGGEFTSTDKSGMSEPKKECDRPARFQAIATQPYTYLDSDHVGCAKQMAFLLKSQKVGLFLLEEAERVAKSDRRYSIVLYFEASSRLQGVDPGKALAAEKAGFRGLVQYLPTTGDGGSLYIVDAEQGRAVLTEAGVDAYRQLQRDLDVSESALLGPLTLRKLAKRGPGKAIEAAYSKIGSDQ